MLVLTEDQSRAAMDAADSDLKYLLTEVGVAEEVQGGLVSPGFHYPETFLRDRRVQGGGEDRDQCRDRPRPCGR